MNSRKSALAEGIWRGICREANSQLLGRNLVEFLGFSLFTVTSPLLSFYLSLFFTSTSSNSTLLQFSFYISKQDFSIPISKNPLLPNKIIQYPKFFLTRESNSQFFAKQALIDNSKSNNTSQHVEMESLEMDPALRKPIVDFHPDLQDSIRRIYLIKKPHRPNVHNYLVSMMGGNRQFNPKWYAPHMEWMEYSETEDAVFCLPCYLFKNVTKNGGGEAFVGKGNGFRGWNHRTEGLNKHASSDGHKLCIAKSRNLMNPKQSIQTCIRKQTEILDTEYAIKLKTSFEAAKLLMRGRQTFRAHDEKLDSSYQGHFLEYVKELRKSYGISDFRGMTCPKVQRDICCVSAFLITSKIVSDIRNDFFAVLIDESDDCSGKEQMIVCVRYVNSTGCVLESFLGIVHVKETNSLSLKNALLDLLTPYKLSVSNIRGQGYDGASNMSGRLGGLKTLLQNENSAAYYVHCFAHQLQLALVAAVKCHVDVSAFFGLVNSIVNIIQCSNKRQELLRDAQLVHLVELVDQGLVETGRGLNQQSSLSKAGDTRWGSHYRTLTSIASLFGPVISVLETILEDVSCQVRGEAMTLLDGLQSFGFVFMLCLMVDVLGVTHALNLALQRCDQALLNAVNLVRLAKLRLQKMRDNDWDSLLSRVVDVCIAHDIDVPDMAEPYYQLKKSRRQAFPKTNLHHYKNDCFLNILDVQLKELNERFDVENTELLHCVTCLSPSSKFESFDVDKLLRMTEFYPADFRDEVESSLRNELLNYTEDVQDDPRFFELEGLADLCKQLVASGKFRYYGVVYKLVKLSLVLPIATASVERVFSAIKHVKSELRNKMGDQWLNDRLVPFVERDLFMSIDPQEVLDHFQKMSTRRQEL